jgi:hypothetical protein
MNCEIILVNDEVRSFTSSFFPTGSFNHPGTNSETCVVAKHNNEIIGVLQFRLNRVNNVSSIVFVCIRKDSPRTTYNQLLETYLTFLRSENIFTFYSHMTLETAERHWLTGNQKLDQKRKRIYPVIQDWNVYLHKTLAANEIASEEVIQRFALGTRVYNHPIVVLKHELKDEFRTI